MSDRVVIEGGTEIGRDHFPFPTIATDLTPTGYHYGPRTPFPFVVDASSYLKWFYVVRQWSLSCILSVTYNGSDPPTSGIEVEIDPTPFEAKVFTSTGDRDNGTAGAVPTRESGIILPKLGLDFTFEGHASADPDVIVEDWTRVYNQPVVNTSTDVDVFVTFVLSLQFGIPYWQGGLRPLFGFDVTVRDYALEETGQDALVDTFESSGLREVGSFKINDAPGGLPIITLPIETPDNARLFTIDSADVTLSPLTYWTYATKAGLPVYDTATGAQLRDPLS